MASGQTSRWGSMCVLCVSCWLSLLRPLSLQGVGGFLVSLSPHMPSNWSQAACLGRTSAPCQLAMQQAAPAPFDLRAMWVGKCSCEVCVRLCWCLLQWVGCLQVLCGLLAWLVLAVHGSLCSKQLVPWGSSKGQWQVVSVSCTDVPCRVYPPSAPVPNIIHHIPGMLAIPGAAVVVQLGHHTPMG